MSLLTLKFKTSPEMLTMLTKPFLTNLSDEFAERALIMVGGDECKVNAVITDCFELQ